MTRHLTTSRQMSFPLDQTTFPPDSRDRIVHAACINEWPEP